MRAIPSHRVAVVQAGSTLFDTPAHAGPHAGHCETLRQTAAELAVFPEAYIGGYPKGLDFGARVGVRTPAGRDEFQRYWASAIEIPGPQVRRIAAFAAEARCTIVVGVIEREGGTLSCTALTFGADGAHYARPDVFTLSVDERARPATSVAIDGSGIERVNPTSSDGAPAIGGGPAPDNSSFS